MLFAQTCSDSLLLVSSTHLHTSSTQKLHPLNPCVQCPCFYEYFESMSYDSHYEILWWFYGSYFVKFISIKYSIASHDVYCQSVWNQLKFLYHLFCVFQDGNLDNDQSDWQLTYANDFKRNQFLEIAMMLSLRRVSYAYLLAERRDNLQ